MDRDYFKISIEQWGYGNAKILQEMMEQHEIDSKRIIDYLEYTKTIHRYLNRFVRGSVWLYDREYREQQHRLKFAWGTPQPQIHEFQLIPKQNNVTLQLLGSINGARSLRLQ